MIIIFVYYFLIELGLAILIRPVFFWNSTAISRKSDDISLQNHYLVDKQIIPESMMGMQNKYRVEIEYSAQQDAFLFFQIFHFFCAVLLLQILQPIHTRHRMSLINSQRLALITKINRMKPAPWFPFPILDNIFFECTINRIPHFPRMVPVGWIYLFSLLFSCVLHFPFELTRTFPNTTCEFCLLVHQRRER